MTVAEDKKFATARARTAAAECSPRMVEDSNLTTGRCAVIHCLDCVLAHPDNLDAFARAIQVAINDDPMAVLKNYVMPLTPKDKPGDDSDAPGCTPQAVAAQLCAMGMTVGNAVGRGSAGQAVGSKPVSGNDQGACGRVEAGQDV